jgi:hypothetical protein
MQFSGYAKTQPDSYDKVLVVLRINDRLKKGARRDDDKAEGNQDESRTVGTRQAIGQCV